MSDFMLNDSSSNNLVLNFGIKDVEVIDDLTTLKRDKDVGNTNDLITANDDKNFAVNMVSHKKKEVDRTQNISLKKNESKHSKTYKRLVQQKLNLILKEHPKSQQEVTTVYDKYILYGHPTSSNDLTKSIGNKEAAITDAFFIVPSGHTDELISKRKWCVNKEVVDTASNKRQKVDLTQNKDEHSHHKRKLVQEKLSLTGNKHSNTTQQAETSCTELIFHSPFTHEANLDSPDSVLIKLPPDICYFHYIRSENLSLKYDRIFSRILADRIFTALEEQVEYLSGNLLKVKVFGKWHNIPRKQACYGDSGFSYAFSGNCLPARSWCDCSVVNILKNTAESICKHPFNFVLINRYKDGQDHMGEHRDDEKDLLKSAPIASMSFGQSRDFILRHKDSRGRKASRKIRPITLNLEHGSLLIMEPPTNEYWYHSLPVRANAKDVRINLTFRYLVG